MSRKLALAFVCSLLASEFAAADTIFYLHGRIVEDEGPRPVHEYFGLYDYPAIVEALGSDGAKVISEVRATDTNAYEYSKLVADQIEALIESGDSPESITVVGFSKGGSIAIFTSHRLDHPGINFVILAACADWVRGTPELALNGNVLSIYESSDELAGSCKELAARSADLGSFTERMIETGKEHGAFYLPRAIWVEPLLAWIRRNHAGNSKR